MADKEKFEKEALAEFLELTGIPKEEIKRYGKVHSIKFKTLGEIYGYEFKTSGLVVELCHSLLPVLYFPKNVEAIKALEQKPCEDAISRKEAIDSIRQLYLNLASQKAVIDILKVLPSVTPQEPVLNKIRSEIIDTGAYEQEVHGKTDFLDGINYCLGVINKHMAESEES